MSHNVKESDNIENKDSINVSSVMSKIACHYVSLPKVILTRIDDPLFPSTLKPKERQIIKLYKSKRSENTKIKKVSPKSKNIPSKKIVEKHNKTKVTSRTRKAVSTLLKGAGKRSSRIRQTLHKSQLIKQLPKKHPSNKLVSKVSANTNFDKKSRGRPRKVFQIQKKSPLHSEVTETTPIIDKKRVVKRKLKDISLSTSEIKPKVGKKTVVLSTPKKTAIETKQQVSTETVEIKSKQKQIIREMTAKDEEIMEELENTDSEKSFGENSDFLYKELIQSLDSTPKKVMTNPGIKKQTLSKNVIKLSGPVQKTPGAVIKGGIIRKNTIPIQTKSKPAMKPNQTNSSINMNQIKSMSSGITPNKQKMLVSSIQNVKQKLLVSQTSKSKSPVPVIRQKAITVQSVEAINSKAKKSELVVPTTPKVVTTKQTATVTPLTKARKSFTSVPPKVNFNNKVSKGTAEGAESEPVNLLSKLVGLPISASKLQVVSLSPQNAIQVKNSTSPPLTNIKTSEGSKTQYVSPTTHDKDVENDNDGLDLLKLLADDNEASTSQKALETAVKNSPNISKGNEMKNTLNHKDDTSMDTDETETVEDKPRTIYDLMAEINLIYPSWNLHIMPDTNSFCIAQVSRGRLGIPALKKCIELDEEYNAKVFVHQYHCKRFDGQYDSEESIIALIHEINALRA